MNYELRIMNYELRQLRKLGVSLIFFLFSLFSFSQVASSIDSTSIKIGEQITYKIEVETDSTDLVVFPEGQTFLPLEVIESYKVDTTKLNDKFNLIKKYGLTQFDSGVYTIPRQKIIIGTKTIFTDSLKVEVNNIAVDTTKQKLFDIKPIIEVDKSPSKWWLYLIYILLILALVAGLLYWFIWREKTLTHEEKVALLPPYERAKLALQKLNNSEYLQNEEIKEYYSELTGIIRKYLDEKVYNHALESTTEELINRLHLLKDGQQIDLSKEDIKSIETILKRADLVKFAKSKPDITLAKIDRNTIDIEIDNVKESLPEPTEEEKLLNQKYKEKQERKKKRRKIIITIIIAVFLLFATLTGFVIKYDFNYVKDTVFGHESKELLEIKDWVTSEYGAPGITISTPKVLKRTVAEIPEELKGLVEVTLFSYGDLNSNINIVVGTTKFKNQAQEEGQDGEKGKNEIDLNKAAEGSIKILESKGVENIIVKQEQFITPNGAAGLKTYGTARFPKIDKFESGNYVLLGFTTKNILQTIMLTWKGDDVYADKIVERILNSIELIKLEEE
jgi:heme/copper-type cytochrome/quinol oxidase subunit 2